jgi:hypothetical protein
MHRRNVATMLVLLVGLGFVGLAIPRAAVACSCVAPDDILRGAGEDVRSAVLTGVPGAATPAGVPVTVSRWFTGAGAAPVVFLDVEGIQESSCGTNAPPPGHEYLFVVWRDDAGRFSYHGCSVAADLATDDGQARLAHAQSVFGPPSTPEPQAGAPASDPVQDAIGAATMFLPFVAVLLFGAAFLLGIVGVLRRTRPRRG